MVAGMPYTSQVTRSLSKNGSLISGKNRVTTMKARSRLAAITCDCLERFVERRIT